jgi:PIN domain nuclease of toxin-antitoxin system
MNTLYVVDTHVLIWYFIGSKRLQKKLKEKIDAVRNLGGHLLVPTIVLAEALDIAEKGRVGFDFDAMYRRIKVINESRDLEP